MPSTIEHFKAQRDACGVICPKCGCVYHYRRQSKIVVMSESSFMEKPKRVNHLKMVVIHDLQADTVSNTVKEHIDPLAESTTDDAASYSKLAEHVKSHHAQVVKPEDLPKILPWVNLINVR